MMYYHGIILRGLVELASVLPKNHPQRESIVAAAVRAANHAIRAQREDGALRLHPRRREAYNGTLVLAALLEGERRLGWKLDDVIAGLAHCPLGFDLSDPSTPKSAIDDGIVAAAAAWRRAKR
jgi:hypothetical protein